MPVSLHACLSHLASPTSFWPPSHTAVNEASSSDACSAVHATWIDHCMSFSDVLVRNSMQGLTCTKILMG